MKQLGSTTLLCAALVLVCGSVQAEAAAPARSNGSATSRGAQTTDHQATLRSARAQVSWMSLRSDHVFRWLRKARAEGDHRRARCLDRKVSEAHAVERLGRKELGAVRRAVRAGKEGYAHHLARLQRFADRSNQVMAAAHRCGQKVSRRQRLPTVYRVRMVEPELPPVSRGVRTVGKGERRRSPAQAKR